MSKKLKQVINFPWYPFLFSLFPALSLLAYNVAEIKVNESWRSLVTSFGLTVLLFLVLNFFLKDRDKAAALSTVGLLLFFSYGHLYHLLEPIQLSGFSLGRHRLLLPIYLLASGLMIGASIRFKANVRLMTQTLNLISLSALMIPVFQIVTYSVQEGGENPSLITSLQSELTPGEEPQRDIYYIILDGYSRDDVLENFFEYDNSAFLNELSALGFYVADCSMSNYAQTQLSLASALNMNYIDALGENFTAGNTSRAGMPALVKRSTVRQLLEELGYTTIAFETGYYWTQVEDAGVYLSPKNSTASLLDITVGLNGFEALMIKNSAALILVDGASLLPKFLQPNLDHPNQIHRQRVLFILDQLEKLPVFPGPKFVFAHIVSPHRPFVFGSNGEVVEEIVNEKEAYRDQVAYINSRIISILEKIISNSMLPPIIIIQGDHGGVNTSHEDRMAILNAYYLPDGGEPSLYKSITPVNSFRLIFNRYFGAAYDKLEDRSYHSSYKDPFSYTLIPNDRPGCP